MYGLFFFCPRCLWFMPEQEMHAAPDVKTQEGNSNHIRFDIGNDGMIALSCDREHLSADVLFSMFPFQRVPQSAVTQASVNNENVTRIRDGMFVTSTIFCLASCRITSLHSVYLPCPKQVRWPLNRARNPLS